MCVYQIQLVEVNLLSALDDLRAPKVDFGDMSVTRHPEYILPEVRLLRMHSVAGADFQFEVWSSELYLPMNSTTCAHDSRQLLRVRHLSNVSIICFNVSRETLGL